MGFISKLKSFFFNEQEVGIINIGDLMQIPGREYFKDNEEALNLIDKYKEEYLNILQSKKTIYSRDLSFDDLQSEILMNVDLVLEIVGHNRDLYDEIKKPKSKNIIDMIKLKLYLNRIEEMETETIIRLIALKELEKGRRVPHINRNALKEEINILTTNLVIFINQKRAINIETSTYLSNVVIDNNANENVDKELMDLIKLAKVYIDISDVQNMDVKPEIKIAIIERRLEIYCYKHKNEITKLTKEVNDLDNTDLSFTHLKKEDFLRIITDLEAKYEIFRRYGRNVVTQEHLYNLYRVKFDIITFVLEDYNIMPYIKSVTEKEIYEDIIFKKKEKIIRGKNSTIKEIFGKNEKKAIKYLASLFQEDTRRSEIFSEYAIATSSTILKLLLTFDSEYDFRRFYDNILVDTKKNMEYFEDSYFTWQDKIPLSSLMEFMSPEIATEYYMSKDYKNKYLYNLYYLSKEISGSYHLPEGLVSINIPSYEPPYLVGYKINHHYLRKIRTETKNKSVFFPDTLENITGDLFGSTKISKVHFNARLKSISQTLLEPYGQLTIHIPTKLETVGRSTIDLSNIKVIYFFDEEAKLFNKKNKQSLCELLYDVFMINAETSQIVTTNNQKIVFETHGINDTVTNEIDLEELCKDIKIDKNISHIFLKGKDGIEYYRLNPEDIRIIVNILIHRINVIKEPVRKLVRRK